MSSQHTSFEDDPFYCESEQSLWPQHPIQKLTGDVGELTTNIRLTRQELYQFRRRAKAVISRMKEIMKNTDRTTRKYLDLSRQYQLFFSSYNNRALCLREKLLDYLQQRATVQARLDACLAHEGVLNDADDSDLDISVSEGWITEEECSSTEDES